MSLSSRSAGSKALKSQWQPHKRRVVLVSTAILNAFLCPPCLYRNPAPQYSQCPPLPHHMREAPVMRSYALDNTWRAKGVGWHPSTGSLHPNCQAGGSATTKSTRPLQVCSTDTARPCISNKLIQFSKAGMCSILFQIPSNCRRPNSVLHRNWPAGRQLRLYLLWAHCRQWCKLLARCWISLYLPDPIFAAEGHTSNIRTKTST